MTDFFNKEKNEDLDDQIAAIYKQMNVIGVIDEDYPRLLTLLERYHELKAKKRREPVSLDTWAAIGGNLFGIFIIVAYERTHASTSKGFNQLIRPKT